MTEILFYHLTESTLEAALPPLLEKSLERGWRVVVQAGSEERRDALDTHLWVYREQSFVGHGTDKEKHAEHQPVLLTAGEGNPNNADIRFLVDNATPPALDSYRRAVFMFDGHDVEQVEAARGHWKAAKGEGHEVTYWQQTPQGRWERKA
ncbi:MAG: DNA polymerase III subunit chi [Rhizobiaceae bacterium]